MILNKNRKILVYVLVYVNKKIIFPNTIFIFYKIENEINSLNFYIRCL